MLRVLAVLACTVLSVRAEAPVTRLACGSCYKPRLDNGIWDKIRATNPQVFLFMGDNIYADTEDMERMRARYAELLNHPGYQRIRQDCTILPIWDDHDYGANDAGADYPQRRLSSRVFFDSFEFPEDHPARATPGVFHSWTGGPPGKRLQVIMLDTRYFRSPLSKERVNGRKTLVPDRSTTSTILGDEQWRWLEAELRKPADLRFVVSSIQVITTQHRFEKWSNFPRERARLFKLLADTKTRRVILFSGDRHLAELSRILPAESGLPDPLFELTASGMTHAGAPEGVNRHRIGSSFTRTNFGTIGIEWTGDDPVVSLAVCNGDGKPVLEQVITFPHGS